eukprot:c32451_g1_i1.p2 GENE.c32451_g1_i1~~c32451_g1_i1.p2  ORF type:complete len:111 (-),score=4.73 c32451_g1_i1:305-637(-)
MTALLTRDRFVTCSVTGLGECAATKPTREWSVTSVGSIMTDQSTTLCKGLAAAHVGTLEWSLSCMSSDVRCEVMLRAKHLAAVRNIAGVDSWPPTRRSHSGDTRVTRRDV